MILVLGSHALNQHKFIREPLDIDLLTDQETLTNLKDTRNLKIIPRNSNHFVGRLDGKRIEISIVRPGTTNEMLMKAHHNKPTSNLLGLNVIYCELDWLYALKMSHRFKKNCPHFHKTMKDIHILRELGAKIPDLDWFKLREKYTLARNPNLLQSKDNFFTTPGINYVYDHDSIHRAMALGPKPAYLYYITEGAEVFCSRKKWNEVSEQTRINGVLEEALVLALERSQIPFNFEPNPKRSFEIALMRVCTSITSGWFREWAWENYYTVQTAFSNLPWLYTEKFKQGLEQGIVNELGPKNLL